MKIRIFLLCLLSFNCLSQGKLSSNAFYNFDNDKQSGVRYYTTWGNKYKNYNFGIMNGVRYYVQDTSYKSLTDFRFNISHTFKSELYFNYNISILNTKDWNILFFDGAIRYPYKKFNFELYTERETIGTPKTIDLKLSSLFIGVSFDYKINDRFTLVNGVSNNNISDGNNRWYTVNRLSYTFENEKSYIDLKINNMFSGDWSPNYFSPERSLESTSGFGFYKNIFKNKYYLKFYIASGFQNISTDYNNLTLINFKLTTNFEKNFYGEISYGLRKVNDYGYSYGQFRIIYNVNKPHIKHDPIMLYNEPTRFYHK